MSECCGGKSCDSKLWDGPDGHVDLQVVKTEFWNWWKQKANEQEVNFTLHEVLDLLAEVKEFNAGAIDKYLSNYVDKVMAKKLEEKKS